jgi:hypothetical protein
MTVVSFSPAVKDCRLTVEPSVLLTHIREDVWAAAIEVRTFSGEFIKMHFPFRAAQSGNGRWDQVPTTHEVLQAFRHFRQRLLERELIPLIRISREVPRTRSVAFLPPASL